MAILLPSPGDIYKADVVLSPTPLRYTLRVTDSFNRLLGLTNPKTRQDTTRIVAFDLARGLAILGMFTAHMWVTPTNEMPEPPLGFLVGLTHGRSASLFALLAGVSLGIIRDSLYRSSSSDDPTLSLTALRRKTALRAVYLIGIAATLALFNERILLILDNYGIWFLAVIPLLSLRTRTLLWIGTCNLLVLVPLFHYLKYVPLPYLVTLALGITDYYFPVYLTYVLVGLILWRLGWGRRRELARRCAKWGAVAAGVALSAGTLLDSWRLGRPSLAWLGMEAYNSVYLVPASPETGAVEYPDLNLLTPAHWQFWYNAYLYIAPHTDSTLEAVANLGWSVALVSVMLLAPSGLYRALSPVAALGSMALTAYSLHIVWHIFTWKFFGPIGLFPSYVLMIAVFLTLASLWRLRFRRGPLEALFHRISTPSAP